jgi:hypothetical protein
MKLARHAPAGRPVPRAVLTSAGRRDGQLAWPDLQTELFASGTAALGAALKSALGMLPYGKPSRVVLPAYGCPNLVAAVLWAGGTPDYYDLSRDTLAPVPGAVETLITDRAAVMLHVDAFGADTLPPEVSGVPAGLVVHDLAQSFAPFQEGWKPRVRHSVASFGRAKPVTLTLGGVLVTSPGSPSPVSPGEQSSPSADVSESKLSLRAAGYALSLHPGVFGILSRIPALGIGQTHFTALTHAHRLPQRWHALVAAAVADLRTSLPLLRSQTAAMLRLARESGARVLSSAMEAEGRLPLWRVPIVCPSPASAALLAKEGVHLGISRLYVRPLPRIIGMDTADVAARWPNAAWVAERLITLPTHGRLGERLESELRKLLERRLR